MRNFVLTLLCVTLFASAAMAKKRDWKDARIISIDGPLPSHFGIPPIVPIYHFRCQVQIDDVTYVLNDPGYSRPRVTLYRLIRIAIDGQKAHIIDERGKEITVRIDLINHAQQRVPAH
jgi:hypothetical protein